MDIEEVIMGLSPVYERWCEETLSQGHQEGRTSLVELLLTQKFGSLSDRMTQKITQLTRQQCERLAIALGGIPTIDALNLWFGEIWLVR